MKFTQPCPTLCDPMDYTVHGILQARILEWVALPFSRGSSQLQADSLPAEPQRKPKNTNGVCGKLSWHTEGRTVDKLGRVRADSWEEESFLGRKGKLYSRQRQECHYIYGSTKKERFIWGMWRSAAGVLDIYRSEKISLAPAPEGFFSFLEGGVEGVAEVVKEFLL